MKLKFEHLKEYHFEFKHLLVLLIALGIFQIMVSFIHKSSLQNLLINTQNLYQRDSAERLANLTSTSLELLLENTAKEHSPEESQKIIQAFNIILSQQLLEQNIREICLLVSKNDSIIAIDNGRMLHDYFFGEKDTPLFPEKWHTETIKLYKSIKPEIEQTERTHSLRANGNIFHVFVPFVPKGEYAGAIYIKNTADFSFITEEIIASFDEISIIFASLIFLGLLAMFFISSHTVKERDDAQKNLFREREKYLLEQVDLQKELMFTKRIYHTHHKAEKVMGFIKEDLRRISEEDVELVKYRVSKYANFISRVIYDMKWYDPPLQSIRNPIFSTDINEVIKFIVNNIFMRVSSANELYWFDLHLDENFPKLHINEFVIWEIIEPILQNAVDHAGAEKLEIKITTAYDPGKKSGLILISDNGQGISQELLQGNQRGVQKIFMENISTKTGGPNTGYGCYIAYEMAVQRCGWKLIAGNSDAGGGLFTIRIENI